MVAEQFPEVLLVISQENLGFARANNLGLTHVTGQFVALVNSDVLLHEACFDRLSDFLITNGKVGLVGPRIVGGDGKLQRTCRLLPTIWNTFCATVALDAAFPRSRLFSGREMRHWDQESSADVEVLSGCFWVARKAAVDQVGGLDERFFFYAEDVDWCKRFKEAGWGVHFVAEASATHFGGGSSANAPLRYCAELLRANLAYWRKHHGIAGQSAYYIMSVTHHLIRLVALFPKKMLGKKAANNDLDYRIGRSLACLNFLFFGKKQ
jgi:GT2 family glycosyltransferase